MIADRLRGARQDARALLPWTYLFDKEPTVESGALGQWAHYDPAEAKRLLAAAGAENLTLNNIYYAYSEAANERLDRGPRRPVPRRRHHDDRRQGRLHRVQLAVDRPQAARVLDLGWATSGFDADNWFYGQVHSKSPGNRWHINDPQIDQWAEQQQVELEPARRARRSGARSGTATCTGVPAADGDRVHVRGLPALAARHPLDRAARPATTARTTTGATRSRTAGSTSRRTALVQEGHLSLYN